MVLGGCFDPGPANVPAPQLDLVWPQPPLTPRIRFVQTISGPEDIGARSGFFRKLWEFVKGAPQRRLSSPYGIHKDSAGRLYVVDTFHKAVRVFDPTNGDHYWFPDKAVEGFESPIGVVAADDGRIYVSDSQAKVVHVFGDNGKRYLQAIGGGVLERPTGLALDPATGDLLVVDTLAGQIVVFDTEDLRSKAFIGRKGDERRTFNFPTNITVAKDGTVYVTDSMNFRIQALGPDFAFRRSFGAPGDAPGFFSRPKGVATDSEGHVYVVDALFDNVQIFDSEGRLLLAFGSSGSAPGEFWLPNEIFIDAEDRIYVSDAYNQRIQVFQYLKERGKP